MILLTRLDKSRVLVNIDTVKFVEATPDTVVTLASGACRMRWKITTTCRASIPTSISTRRSWRRSRSKVRVLGIDCGSQRTGYGVIDSDGAEHRMVAAGVICTSPKWPFEKRLLEIATGLRCLIREHAPEFGAVEEVFHAANAKTALKLAHVRGVALLAIA